MLKKRIVVALGGNALGNSPTEQLNIVKHTAQIIVNLIGYGHELIIVHGNGPQIGMINDAFDNASKNNVNIPKMSFPECGAMSQAYIGYHLQNAIRNELTTRSIQKQVVTLVTQTIVDALDAAFHNPTKPIGPFYSAAIVKDLSNQHNWIMKEDSGRGWRRVIASPQPLDFVEKDMIIDLVNLGYLVICGGGGGIPVVQKYHSLLGVEAVIDKDFASAKLAEIINADLLMILTAVDKVSINFNSPLQQDLATLTVTEATNYITNNQFGVGSMLPKVQAAIKFVKSAPHRITIITSLSNALEAMNESSGTTITNN